jgi:hypothetical protein
VSLKNLVKCSALAPLQVEYQGLECLEQCALLCPFPRGLLRLEQSRVCQCCLGRKGDSLKRSLPAFPDRARSAERLRELWISTERVRAGMELSLTTDKILTGNLGK